MKLYSLIMDDFLAEPLKVRARLLTLNYKSVESPFDGVEYPDIATEVPKEIQDEIEAKITLLLGPIKPTACFARLSIKGRPAPHQAHTDTVMGRFTVLIYMTRPEDCQGGTSILQHENGMQVQPITDEGIKILADDTNTPEKWIVVGGSPMAFNRMFLVASELFHRAEPIGGFGEDLADGRLVLTMFFNI